MVAAWSNGKHDPPEHIARVVEGLKRSAGADRVPDEFLYRVAGVDAARVRQMKEATKAADPLDQHAARMALLGPLDRPVDVVGVGKVRVIDVLAAFGYMDLQRAVEAFGHKKAKPGTTNAGPVP